MTDQIIRSSRSVSTNITEAYRKRQYVKHYSSKLTDSDAENSEAATWLMFALECEYINRENYLELKNQSEEVGKILFYMLNNPSKFGETI